jgi:hypothetical protein
MSDPQTDRRIFAVSPQPDKAGGNPVRLGLHDWNYSIADVG